MSVAMSPDGTILVTDFFNNRIQAFTRDGKFLFTFGSEGWEPGFFQYPHGIVVDEQTRFIFVADQLNNRVQIFNSKGKFQHEILLESSPMALVIDRKQRLLIAKSSDCIAIY